MGPYRSTKSIHYSCITVGGKENSHVDTFGQAKIGVSAMFESGPKGDNNDRGRNHNRV